MTGGVGSRGRALDDRTRVACDVARALYDLNAHDQLSAFMANLAAVDMALWDAVFVWLCEYGRLMDEDAQKG